MPTTTICRSRTFLAAVSLVALPAAGQAQTAPNIQRPLNSARNAAAATNANTAAQQNVEGQQPAQQPSNSRVQITQGPTGQPGIASQNPSTHTVQQGETLWALAQQFLGDPLLWPEIYRLNTDVVEDPHWIYPGEELRLSPGPVVTTDTSVVVDQSVAVTPRDTATTQVRASLQGPTIFHSQAAASNRMAELDLRESRAYRAVREGEYFSSGFLTENQPLPSGRILTNLQTSTLGAIRTRETASQFEDVAITLPPGETLQRGDLLLSYRRAAETASWGEVIRPTGLLRYQGPAGDRHRATVMRQFQTVSDGQELLKVSPFVFNSSARPVAVSGGVEGRVIAQRDPREIIVLQDVIFIDKGENDGVRLGDVFQVYRTTDSEDQGIRVEQDQARILIVNTRSRTATGVVIEVYRGDVGTSSAVRQIRRMPS